MAKLDSFGFPKANPDPAMVYRTLRYLEKEGFVASKWDTKGTGPAKRNYGLTRKGIGLLHLWAETIETRRQVLGKFLKQYRQFFRDEQ
jgi:DNA-binding PadR family transcriptional regulator